MLKAFLIETNGNTATINIEHLSDIGTILNVSLANSASKTLSDESLSLVSLQMPAEAPKELQSVGIFALHMQDSDEVPLLFKVKGPMIMIQMQRINRLYDIRQGQGHMVASLSDTQINTLDQLSRTYFANKPMSILYEKLSLGYQMVVETISNNSNFNSTYYVGTNVNSASHLFDKALIDCDEAMDELEQEAQDDMSIEVEVSLHSPSGSREILHHLSRDLGDHWTLKLGRTLYTRLFADSIESAKGVSKL